MQSLFTEPGARRVQRTQAQPPASLRPVLDQAISDIVYSSPGLLLDLLVRYRLQHHLPNPLGLARGGS